MLPTCVSTSIYLQMFLCYISIKLTTLCRYILRVVYVNCVFKDFIFKKCHVKKIGKKTWEGEFRRKILGKP
jgi:hypothetical protein